MTTELDIKILARLRAHELLIQHLLQLAFQNDPDAIQDFADRQMARLDTSRLPDLDPNASARLPYEMQEALASILDGAVRSAKSKQR